MTKATQPRPIQIPLVPQLAHVLNDEFARQRCERILKEKIQTEIQEVGKQFRNQVVVLEKVWTEAAQVNFWSAQIRIQLEAWMGGLSSRVAGLSMQFQRVGGDQSKAVELIEFEKILTRILPFPEESSIFQSFLEEVTYLSDGIESGMNKLQSLDDHVWKCRLKLGELDSSLLASETREARSDIERRIAQTREVLEESQKNRTERENSLLRKRELLKCLLEGYLDQGKLTAPSPREVAHATGVPISVRIEAILREEIDVGSAPVPPPPVESISVPSYGKVGHRRPGLAFASFLAAAIFAIGSGYLLFRKPIDPTEASSDRFHHRAISETLDHPIVRRFFSDELKDRIGRAMDMPELLAILKYGYYASQVDKKAASLLHDVLGSQTAMQVAPVWDHGVRVTLDQDGVLLEGMKRNFGETSKLTWEFLPKISGPGLPTMVSGEGPIMVDEMLLCASGVFNASVTLNFPYKISFVIRIPVNTPNVGDLLRQRGRCQVGTPSRQAKRKG